MGLAADLLSSRTAAPLGRRIVAWQLDGRFGRRENCRFGRSREISVILVVTPTAEQPRLPETLPSPLTPAEQPIFTCICYAE
jgi:hypothetical protein